MPVTTLTSLAHASTYLPDRTRLDDVADDLHRHLRSATNMIASYTGLSFDAASRVLMLDTYAVQSPTPGAALPPFSRNGAEAIFDLPVPGQLSNLVVRYRGGYPFDRDFDWSDVDPLVENEDYVYQPATKRLRILFATEQMPDGIRLEFTSGYAVTPEVLLGSRREDFFARMGLETALAPLVSMFRGVEQKMLSDCATVAGTAPTLAEVTIQPPTPTALHTLTVVTPRDAALLSTGGAVTLALVGVDAGNAETVLHQVTIPATLQGQRYALNGNPAQAYTRYKLRVMVASGAATVAVSSLLLSYVDTERQHMQGAAPEPLSEACAMLAVYLMQRANMDGTGKEADETNRAYSGGAMPREVRAILTPYRASRVSFI